MEELNRRYPGLEIELLALPDFVDIGKRHSAPDRKILVVWVRKDEKLNAALCLSISLKPRRNPSVS